MQELTQMVKQRVHSDRVVMVLDACHSGATGTAGKGLVRQSNFDADQIVQGSGQLVICSSLPTQTSWESSRYPNGVFTHYLIEGLRQKSGTSPLGDAFEYMRTKVQEEVVRDRGEVQTPVLKQRWEGKALLLAAPPAAPRPGLPQPVDTMPARSGSNPTAGTQPKAATAKKTLTPGKKP